MPHANEEAGMDAGQKLLLELDVVSARRDVLSAQIADVTAEKKALTTERILWVRKRSCFHCKLCYLRTLLALRGLIDRTIVWRPGAVMIAATAAFGISLVITGSWLTATSYGAIVASAIAICLCLPTDANTVIGVGRIKQAITAADSEIGRLSAILSLKSGLESELIARRNSVSRELTRLRQSKQFRLQRFVTQDWKSLRGVPFEQFLESVFKELGYAVATTKASGDQGVDLILAIRGYKIAVQVKGYSGSVSNGAIQEAHTGKAFYKCDACAVITNSQFTISAKELARRVNCILIDEDMLPRVIRGEVDLWGLCTAQDGNSRSSRTAGPI